ncbi:hypothetical protein [Cytobacillus massiliigabonensis]|uniref:hypothetical protein n=1 Tax=Cytobacillus massiliigabonensis TaxID=1871011 RepID=UPI0015E0B75F|nr:hypothetical protein [Cytobacillus massiliigabonensis]
MLKHFFINIIASSLVMKRNLDWHRRIILISIPLFSIFMLLQTKYIIYQIRKANN